MFMLEFRKGDALNDELGFFEVSLSVTDGATVAEISASLSSDDGIKEDLNLSMGSKNDDGSRKGHSGRFCLGLIGGQNITPKTFVRQCKHDNQA